MSDTNGTGVPEGDGADDAAAAQNQAAQFRILTQYIKDLSFENPDALKVLGGNAEQPKMDVSVNVGVTPQQNDQYEVSLSFSVNARSGDNTVFIAELDYAALFLIQGVPQESLQPVLLIECPRLIFPFARRIIADLTRDGGYPPLMLEPIDFVSLYRSQMERQAARQEQQGGETPEAPKG
ncbi:MAG: protein-export chaperone SecB [Alphaproteobacteria bacterium]